MEVWLAESSSSSSSAIVPDEQEASSSSSSSSDIVPNEQAGLFECLGAAALVLKQSAREEDGQSGD